MKKKFSPHWNRSVQPRKQRKYRFQAPLHVKQKFMSSHLAKELRKKYGVRSLGVRKGDKVKVMRGRFKGKSGKIDRVDLRREKVYMIGAEITKKEGSKVLVPLHPSNLLIEELNLEDKRRRERLKESK